MATRSKFSSVPMQQVPAPDPASTLRPVVLVVDDESVIADTLTEILSRSGYAAVSAYDGESALETALLMPPEMLITDVSLPGMNGVDLAITIRRIFPDCKILLFSGHAGRYELVDTASKSGHHFPLISKPVHPGDLLARIAASLSGRPISEVVAS
jgi:DNA-binding response OmpR family regulator